MYAEDELLPISALQHLLFCERQCALIHIERLWADNRLTVEGTQLHERAHSEGIRRRRSIRVGRSLDVRSLRLGLVGKTDVVELHPTTTTGKAFPYLPFPIEYKRGRPKRHNADLVQLCAQALCLEEMWGTKVIAGALYYGRMRRRNEVEFTDMLRSETEQAAKRLHELIRLGETPHAKREPKCDTCSLFDLCLPNGMRPRLSAKRYFGDALAEVLQMGATDM